MGVSIEMTPGPIGRNFGKPVDITPGLRSLAASILRSHFGDPPFCLVRDHDLKLLTTLANGASIYVHDDENFWKQMADALAEHGAITITLTY